MINVAIINKMIEKGFTTQEISQLINGEQEQSGEREQNAEQEQSGEQEQNAEQEQSGEQEQTANTDVLNLINDLTKQVANLASTVKTIQDNNAKSAESTPPKKESAESVIKNFFGVK